MSKTKTAVSPDLDTPTDLSQEAVDKISAALNPLVADALALYIKTKNFHWHVSGRHFRDYHLCSTSSRRRSSPRWTSLPSGEQDRRHTLRSVGHLAKLTQIKATTRHSCRRARCCAN